MSAAPSRRVGPSIADASGVSSSSSSSAALPRLLLVEDDDNLRPVLVRSLRKRFDVVALADGGDAAERMITDPRFDVVLADVQLRGMSGMDLLRVVRTHDLDVPVILMTGLPDLDGAIAAMDLGALTYIKKPFDTPVLDAALERAIKLSALGRAKRDAIAAGIGSGIAASNERAALTASFERALDSLWIAFQPIVDGKLSHHPTIGFEALMRPNDPTMPTPGAMLDAAERLDRVHDLGRVVRDKTASAFAAQTNAGDSLLFVNLHAADLLDDDLFDEAAPLSKLASRGLVVLEITERAAIADVTDARIRTAELRRRGFKIAIDDLGAGYAGLTSFATFEPELVKLDMSLVRDIEASTMKRLIVGRITNLCHDLKMRVVAEGIETEGELACMKELGCDYLQGYLFGRPNRL